VAGTLAAAGLPPGCGQPQTDPRLRPRRIAKTNRPDAEAIARFAEAVQPPPRPVPDQAAQALGELVARRRQLSR
jgi:transposase